MSDTLQTSELLKKVRKIEIKTKGLSNQIFSGEYHSSFKGRGMSFSEVREYQHGDDIRTIDWNVTARFNHPYIKVFEEERELTLMLIIDVSASENFGTQTQLKKEVMIEIAAILSFSAIQNNDKVGVVLFSDKVEKFIPPKKGKSHILAIISTLINFKPQNKGTNINQAVEYFEKVTKKRSTAFLISDFFTSIPFDKSLRIVKKKHDLIALNIYDIAEINFPNLGFIPIQDSETRITKWINTGDKKMRKTFNKEILNQQQKVEKLFRKYGIDYTKICSNKDYIRPLMELFKRRSH